MMRKGRIAASCAALSLALALSFAPMASARVTMEYDSSAIGPVESGGPVVKVLGGGNALRKAEAGDTLIFYTFDVKEADVSLTKADGKASQTAKLEVVTGGRGTMKFCRIHVTLEEAGEYILKVKDGAGTTEIALHMLEPVTESAPEQETTGKEETSEQ